MPGAAVMPAGSFSVLQSNATEMHEMKEDSGSKETCRLKKKTCSLKKMLFRKFNKRHLEVCQGIC